MPQRPLTSEELEELRDTPFIQMKQILEERQLAEQLYAGKPGHSHRDSRLRLRVERCEFDSSEPYLLIAESISGVGFIFSVDGKLMYLVNYK
jgi:hypothetical protein